MLLLRRGTGTRVRGYPAGLIVNKAGPTNFRLELPVTSLGTGHGREQFAMYPIGAHLPRNDPAKGILSPKYPLPKLI